MKEKNFLSKIVINFQNYLGALSDSERKKFTAYFYVILSLFTVSFFGIFAINPTLSTIANLNKQYNDDKIVNDALNKKISNLQLLDFQYKNIQQDLPFVYNAIPKSTKIPQLTRQIENIAGQNGVLITELNFATIEIFPVSKTDSIYSFAFVVNIEGPQLGVNNFLADIINFDRIVGIDKISTGRNEENQYTAEITGRAYFSNK